ncbi:MAG TPA: XRE family transcriptional regulator [Bacteroidetes bacterium]|nr:XRE family transcriptional regulator [Bacteroidota bacterium]
MREPKDDQLIRQFGKRVRKARKREEISQEELALRAELSINQIGRIERGEINTSLIVVGRIAEALNVKVADLF